MPFYKYVCKYCKFSIDNIRRSILEDVSILKCPRCGKTMDQKICNTNFKLTGNGWTKKEGKLNGK